MGRIDTGSGAASGKALCGGRRVLESSSHISVILIHLPGILSLSESAWTFECASCLDFRDKVWGVVGLLLSHITHRETSFIVYRSLSTYILCSTDGAFKFDKMPLSVGRMFELSSCVGFFLHSALFFLVFELSSYTELFHC